MGYTTGENHGLRKHPLYNVWNSIISRCYRENCREYKWYGSKGISMDRNWRKSFLSFYNWCIKNGYKNGMSIERIDVNKNYCPKNCKMIPKKLQARNRKDTKLVEYKGKKMSLAECVEKYSKNKYHTVWQRIVRYNMPLEIALVKPYKYANKSYK
jgi:hypothetical protein